MIKRLKVLVIYRTIFLDASIFIGLSKNKSRIFIAVAIQDNRLEYDKQLGKINEK